MIALNENALCITIAGSEPEQKREQLLKALATYFRNQAVALETSAAYAKDWKPMYTMAELLDALTKPDQD